MKAIIHSLIVFVFTVLPINAQWEQTSCPVAYTGALIVSGTNIFAGTTIGVFLSTDNGINWTEVNTGLTNTNVYSLAESGTNLFAGTTGGVFLSTNNGTSWSNSGLTNYGITSLVVSGTNIFAGAALDGVFLSTNNGTSWIAVNSGLSTLYPVTTLTQNGSYIFAGTDGDGIFRSSNNGSDWTTVNSGLGDWGIMSFAVSGPNIFAGCFWGSVARSTNNGTSWLSFGLGSPGEIFALTVSGSNIFAGTGFEGVFNSTDNGSSWLAMNSGLPNNVDIRSLVANDMFLFAGTDQSGVWRFPLSSIPVELTSFSANSNGREVKLNWTTATETNNKGFEIYRNDNKIGFVEGKGTTSERQNYSYTDKNLQDGTYNYKLYQLDFDGTQEVVGELTVNLFLLEQFSLEQNFPNPFNPSTVIEFSLPQDVANVKLNIYNVLGEKVAELVNTSLTAGRYQYQWNAQDVATGMYIYELKTNPSTGSGQGTVLVKKMILLK